MFRLNIIRSVSALFLSLSVTSLAIANPFTVSISTTQDTSDLPQFFNGEAISISIVLDNGGTTAISQTWTSVDVVSITFSMNNVPNTVTTVFPGASLTTTTGSFVTDASGSLTEVPSEWNGHSPAIISTNDPNTVTNFYINGANRVYYNTEGAAGMLDVPNNINAAYWDFENGSPAPAKAIPTMSQWAMIVLSLMLLVIGLVKTRRTCQ